jgi:hypothetical protein
VTATVKLNREMGFGTVKIENITINRMLPAEFVIRKVTVTQVTPQDSFITRRNFA